MAQRRTSERSSRLSSVSDVVRISGIPKAARFNCESSWSMIQRSVTPFSEQVMLKQEY
jgi:hypothetical protein